MWRARDAMATTSFVAVREIEKGFEGSGITAGRESVVVPVSVRDTWSVESHEAEIITLCSGL